MKKERAHGEGTEVSWCLGHEMLIGLHAAFTTSFTT